MPEFYDPTKPFGEQIRNIIEETHPKDSDEIKVRRVGKRYEVTTLWGNLPTMTVTDGTGTKGSPIWDMQAFDVAGANPFAMTVDDLYEHNYEPYKFQSHLIVHDEHKDGILRSITSLKKLCMQYKWTTPKGRQLPIVIDGGETAVCNTLNGMEFAITAHGYVAKPEDVLEANAKDGDVLIGLASNGIHSNGLTFARDEILGRLKMSLDEKFEWGETVGSELTRPTSIYLEALRELNKKLKEYVTGKVHITGGAFSKLRELSHNDVSYIVNPGVLPLPEIFKFIYRKLQVPENKMLTRYNCGVGYVVSVKREAADKAIDMLSRFYQSAVIGQATKGNGGIKVYSPFSNNVVML